MTRLIVTGPPPGQVLLDLRLETELRRFVRRLAGLDGADPLDAVFPLDTAGCRALDVALGLGVDPAAHDWFVSEADDGAGVVLLLQGFASGEDALAVEVVLDDALARLVQRLTEATGARRGALPPGRAASGPGDARSLAVALGLPVDPAHEVRLVGGPS